MFLSGMKEAFQREVHMPTMPPTALSSLLGFIYSGSLLLSWDNVFEVTEAALRYQVLGALSLCQDFLVAEMDPDSCLDVLALAEAYGLGELAKKAEEFILSHFERVAARPKFLDLPAAQLAHLLAKDSLYVSSEVVFRVVVAWLEEEWGARLPFLAELLKQVRFPLMAPRELQEVEVTAQILIQAPGCREILEGIRSARQPREISSCQPRTPNQVLVLVGGDHVKDDFSRRVPSAAVQFAHRFLAGMGLIRKVEWRALSHMPTPARFRHAMCVLNNQLYIFGGRKYYGQRDILKSVLRGVTSFILYRYDPAHDTWEELADMQQQRNNFAVVCLEGVMYAIGGNLDDTEYLDSVECYTHEDNTWRFTQPLPSALCGHAAAVYDGEIYISGGCDGQNHCLGSMWHYHPVLGCTPRAPMRGERAGHVMEVVCSHLYVAGGLYPLAGGFGDQLACESYDPASDSWGPVASLPMPHLSPASAVLNGHIYVLGGSSCQTCQDSHLVHCYDPQSDCWANVGMMQRAYADIAACVLLVPGHLRQ
ncbi:KLH33 protein, partial [Amia calva]|nr:KLH33 protein [Amia calva]